MVVKASKGKTIGLGLASYSADGVTRWSSLASVVPTVSHALETRKEKRENQLFRPVKIIFSKPYDNPSISNLQQRKH